MSGPQPSKKRTLHPSLRSGAAWLVAFSGKGKDTYIYIYTVNDLKRKKVDLVYLQRTPFASVSIRGGGRFSRFRPIPTVFPDLVGSAGCRSG